MIPIMHPGTAEQMRRESAHSGGGPLRPWSVSPPRLGQAQGPRPSQAGSSAGQGCLANRNRSTRLSVQSCPDPPRAGGRWRRNARSLPTSTHCAILFTLGVQHLRRYRLAPSAAWPRGAAIHGGGELKKLITIAATALELFAVIAAAAACGGTSGPSGQLAGNGTFAFIWATGGGNNDLPCTFYLPDPGNPGRYIFLSGQVSSPDDITCPASVTFAGHEWPATPPEPSQSMSAQLGETSDFANQAMDCQAWNGGNYPPQSSFDQGGITITNLYSPNQGKTDDNGDPLNTAGVSDSLGNTVCSAWASGALPVISHEEAAHLAGRA
jgi:hypothetical protein